MADSSPTASTSNGTPTYSCFQRTVTLYDWWLVKSQKDFQGKCVAISGISSRKEEAVRIFNSAPIIKRYDEFSLETADGIYVLIRGFIHKQHTLDNGFTSEIFKSFLFGFPQNWESCALGCFREEAEVGAYSVNVVMDNVSAGFEEISADGEEKSIPTSLILPEEAPENCKTPFLGDGCKVSKGLSGIDVACGRGGNRRSSRLHNINAYQRKKHKKQHASRSPLKCPDEEPSYTSKAMENCNSDTAVLDNVSANLLEIPSDAVENSFPTSLVTSEKAMEDCNKLFLEDEHDMSIKTGEVNVVHGSGANRRSARLHNVKLYQKKQPAIGGPATHPDKDQTSASAALEKSDGRSETLSTQSQKGIVNTLSGQVSNKSRSRISKTPSAKTEGCYKKKRVTVEREAVRPKRKIIKSASSVKSPQGSDVSPLNKGSKQRLSTMSPESLSLKKSRSGRLLIPPLECWRNQIPIFNRDHEITGIQEGSSLISPFRGISPSLGRPTNLNSSH
ncbi:kinetochore-associated protein KNL-2 homolog isoform X1 [Trifolium pratense]|uniref:kinetochore-associated protein KNL-2 homolog isoform X1 n=1 Tax=Trifolium pratense TaxID=57577 RepID=UPI001E69388F|nr:kinetochore-associated protein KNL-2 homolog isoform X1 [Trifolium pratense]